MKNFPEIKSKKKGFAYVNRLSLAMRAVFCALLGLLVINLGGLSTKDPFWRDIARIVIAFLIIMGALNVIRLLRILYGGKIRRISSTLRYVLRIITQSMKKGPTTAFIKITGVCPNDCPQCYEKDNKAPPMTKELHDLIVRKLYNQGVTFLFYYGGEPMTHPRILDFIKEARKYPFNINICTDIGSSSQKKFRQVLEAGVETLSFSVDSLQLGGARNINAILKNLRFLQYLREEEDFHFGLNCSIVLYKGNMHEIKDIVNKIKAVTRNKVSFSIQPAQYPVPYDQTAEKFSGMLDENDVPEVKRLMAWLKASAKMVPPGQYMDDFYKFIEGHHRWECAANRRMLFIDSTGEMRVCSYFLKQKPPAPLRPLEGVTINDLGPGYWEKVRSVMECNWKYCNQRCYTQGFYCPEFYTKHPLLATVRYFQVYVL